MSSKSELPPIDPFNDPNFPKPPYRRLGDHVSIPKIPNIVPPLPSNPTDNELEKTESWLNRICRDSEVDSPESIPILFQVDLTVKCMSCGKDLIFTGLPLGLVMNGAAVSADHKEARLAAKIEN